MSEIKWLIQDTLLDINEVYKKANALKSLGYNFDFIGVSSDEKFINNLDYILDDKTLAYVFLTGAKIVNFIDKVESPKHIFSSSNCVDIDKEFKKIKNGIFYNENRFSQEFYSKLNLPLLNNNSIFLNIKEAQDFIFNTDMFIKPSKDLKSFGSGILKKGKSINEYIKGTYTNLNTFNDNEIIMISPKVEILSEYRFFVVNKKVITGSRYMKDNSMSISEIIPDYILDTVKEYVTLYQPHEIFNIDIAETEDGIKIIEYNCMNIAGSYDSDLEKLYLEINNFLKGQVNYDI